MIGRSVGGREGRGNGDISEEVSFSRVEPPGVEVAELPLDGVPGVNVRQHRVTADEETMQLVMRSCRSQAERCKGSVRCEVAASEVLPRGPVRVGKKSWLYVLALGSLSYTDPMISI